jgi:hypothetical protein
MLIRLLAGAVFFLLTGQANAQFLTGNKLVEAMREDDKSNMGHPSPDSYMVGVYSGFVAGTFDAYYSAGMLCFTDEVTI